MNTALGKDLFLYSRRRRLSEEVIYFLSEDGNWGAGGRAPTELLTGDVPSRGYCLSFPFFFFPPTPAHFPSSIFLIFTRQQPLSFWQKGERKKKKAPHSQYHLCLPHSQTPFIPHCWGPQSSACLCSAVNAPSMLSWEILQAPSMLLCIYVGSRAFIPALLINRIPITPESH